MINSSFRSTSQMVSARSVDGWSPGEAKEPSAKGPFLHLSNRDTILGTCVSIKDINQTSMYCPFMVKMKLYNLTFFYVQTLTISLTIVETIPTKNSKVELSQHYWKKIAIQAKNSNKKSRRRSICSATASTSIVITFTSSSFLLHLISVKQGSWLFRYK